MDVTHVPCDDEMMEGKEELMNGRRKEERKEERKEGREGGREEGKEE